MRELHNIVPVCNSIAEPVQPAAAEAVQPATRRGERDQDLRVQWVGEEEADGLELVVTALEESRWLLERKALERQVLCQGLRQVVHGMRGHVFDRERSSRLYSQTTIGATA